MKLKCFYFCLFFYVFFVSKLTYNPFEGGHVKINIRAQQLRATSRLLPLIAAE